MIPPLVAIRGEMRFTDSATLAMPTYLVWRTNILSQTAAASAYDEVFWFDQHVTGELTDGIEFTFLKTPFFQNLVWNPKRSTRRSKFSTSLFQQDSYSRLIRD
jgi:hypothetical protein